MSGSGEVEVHHGDPRRQDLPRLAPGAEEGDDAVDAPVAQRRRSLFLAAGLEEERPGSVEAGVAGDALQEPASIGRRSLDQKRDARRDGHAAII
jgi:hypothetical protein